MNIDKNRGSDSLLLRKNIEILLENLVYVNSTRSPISELLDVNKQQISRYENGITSINIETLDTIKLLDADWSEFYRKFCRRYYNIN